MPAVSCAEWLDIMDDKLKDIYDRIQTFEAESAYPSSGCTAAGNDIQGVLTIMADLVDALRDIEAAKENTFVTKQPNAPGERPGTTTKKETNAN